MRKYILNLVLIILFVSMLSACFGEAVTETITQTETQSITVTTSSIREELSTNEIVNKLGPAVAHILGDYGEGTGIVVDSRGYVLTNNHVVEDEDNIIVRIPDREETAG